MRLVLMHIDNLDRCEPGWEEEASFLVPGGEKVITVMPFGALDNALRMLKDALVEMPEQLCDECGGPLAALPPADMWLSG